MRLLGVLLLLVLGFGCREKTYVYELTEQTVAPNNGVKTKAKTTEQFLNIAYANLYQTPLSPNELVRLSELIQSIGDKQLAYEMVIARMMADPAVNLPGTDAMRADLPKFVGETYRRFYVRDPSAAERAWWVNYLETNTNLTAEEVYFSFATSNEYGFY